MHDGGDAHTCELGEPVDSRLGPTEPDGPSPALSAAAGRLRADGVRRAVTGPAPGGQIAEQPPFRGDRLRERQP
jgi:hypothetical protein